MHSAAMSYPEGDVFMFGQSNHGQVGVGGPIPLVVPTDINLGEPPQSQMTDEVRDRGTPSQCILTSHTHTCTYSHPR